MSQQSIQSGTLTGQRQTRVRFDQLKRAPGLRVVGLPELIGLSVAALLALVTVFAYFYFLAPARSRLATANQDRDQLQREVNSAQKIFEKDKTASEDIQKINASLDEFENARLAAPATGRMALYKELNDLIRSNGLRNTSGPTYTTLAPLGTKTQTNASATAEQQSNAKWQSIYPGISVGVTVEGPYQSVRRFVHDIETSRQFLIINAVELESVTQTGAVTEDVVSPKPTPPRAGRVATPRVTQPPNARGTLVSLRLDMATYFRRSSAATP